MQYIRFFLGLVLMTEIVCLSIALQPVSYRRDQFTMLIICGGDMDCEAHKRSVAEAVHFLHDNFIYVKVEEGPRFYQELYSPWLGLEGLSIAVQRAIWRSVIAGNVKKDYDMINLALPFESKYPYLPWEAGIIGLADGICTVPNKRNSMVITKQLGDPYIDRLVIEHEILHVLGAPHSDSGVMTATADNTEQGEFLAPDTREYVDRCLRRPFK